MKQDHLEMEAVAKAASIPYSGSATQSATLTMENDSAICAAIDSLRRVDGTISAGAMRQVFEQFKVPLDEWAQGKVNFDLLAAIFNDDREPIPVPDTITYALRSAVITSDAVRLIHELERTDYVKVDKILQALGGKWNRTKKTHVFSGVDPEDAFANFLQTGKLDKPEKFGFFPTPLPLAQWIVEWAELRSESRVLEPEAGIGNLAKLCAEVVPKEKITCYELQARNCDVLRNLGFAVIQGDFLSVPPEPRFDRIVMNPPFEQQRDIEHFLHALKFLEPGGILVAIMSGGIRFRENNKTKEFRTFLEFHGAEIRDNPDDAFKASVTMVKTVSVKIVRPAYTESSTTLALPVEARIAAPSKVPTAGQSAFDF